MGSNLPVIAPELKDLPHVPVDCLEPFQGELKTLSIREYNKLKKSLQENGIIVPFFVWKETGKLLDGHQRARVMMKEGWAFDVPVVYISAENEQDAKKKLLVISSQYGRITQDGFDAFTFDLDDDWIKETLQFDALPFVFDSASVNFSFTPSEQKEPQLKSEVMIIIGSSRDAFEAMQPVLHQWSRLPNVSIDVS